MTTLNFVGHFLQANGFHDTFKKLEEEHGKPINARLEDLPNKELLDEIVQDRFNFKQFEQTISEIEASDSTILKNWKTPYPREIQAEVCVNETVVSVEYIALKHLLAVATAKQKLIFVNLKGEIVRVFDQLIGKLVIKKVVSGGEYLFLAGMNGVLHKYRLKEEGEIELEKVGELSIHRRLVVDMKHVCVNNTNYVITIGFDKLLKAVDANNFEIIDSFELANVPTCFDVTVNQNQALALVGYNESTVLELVSFETKLQRLYKISINDAEFITSNFSPRTIQFTQEEGQILAAISTSHEPYMRCIIVPITSTETEEIPIKRNQILKNILTMSPQDKFSTPSVVWRNQNQGMWVLGDDGKIRGLDLVTQNLVEIPGHDGKVKFLLNIGDGIVSIGDDRCIKYWS